MSESDYTAARPKALTYQQDQYRRGRLPFQQKRLLAVRAVRSYLVAHPGSTATEVVAGTGIRGHLIDLAAKKLARWERGEDGTPRWWAVPMEAPDS